jgi:hypothetical protein
MTSVGRFDRGPPLNQQEDTMTTLKTLRIAIQAACAAMIFSTISQAGSLPVGVKLVIRDGRTLVDGVYVNGHGPYRFLLDTGSNVNLIESKLADAIGVQATFTDELTAATGVTALSGAEGLEVQLDSAKADRQVFIFSDLKTLHQLSSDIRGVLGQTFLHRFDYLLDLRNKRLEFAKRDIEGERVPFQMVNARPAIVTSVGNMVVDSGTNGVLIFGAESAAISKSIRTLSGSTVAGTLTRKIVAGNRVIWNGDAVAMPRQSKESADGLLPASIFKAIYVSNSEGYMIFN